MKVSRTSIGFASLSLLALAGCPVTADDLCAKGTCDTAVDATAPTPNDAGTDAIIDLPRDSCVDKPFAKECLTNDTALYVSKAADPNGADGTTAHPYPTIMGAVQKITNDKRRIYVCEGTYDEQVALETLPITLIGGITCDFQSRAPKPKIAPPTGIALSIAAVGGTSVLDVIVEGSSIPNEKGSSAIAVFVTRGKNILLRGVEAKANDAQPGAPGAPATVNFDTNQPLANNTTTGAAGGPPICTKCKDGVTATFAGGGAIANGAFSEAGAAIPTVGVDNHGISDTTCGVGTAGANGDARAAATGALKPGVLTATAWNTAATAQPGPIGNPGQGGGGGGADTVNGGGSGGCGGCGGGGGGPGGNGGSSIALLVFESELTLEDSTFTAGLGGAGGTGGTGQNGQVRALGGTGNLCGGGPGGFGAGGGGGGGGAGGYSLGLGYVGAEPSAVRTTLVKRTGGDVGKGGEPGGPAIQPSGGKPGNAGLDGALGKAEEKLDIK